MRASFGTYLNQAQLQHAAPSIFATAPRDDLSDRYTFVPTSAVLERLADEGFAPVEAFQSTSRLENGRQFARHLVRLRRTQDLGAQRVVGDVFPEVVMTNSHNGSSTLVLEGGLFRLACSNGMCMPESVERIVTRHTGDIGGEVIDGCISVVKQAEEFRGRALTWQGIQLTRPEQLLLAETAIGLRDSTLDLEPARILSPRRWQDRDDNLWAVTNRLQEALVKGGTKGISAKGKRIALRSVASVSENIRLNRAIMTMAEKFAELKGA